MTQHTEEHDDLDTSACSVDTWSHFIRQAREHPMLPAQAQIDLAWQWVAGRKAQKRLASKRSKPTPAQRQRLNETIRQGLAARAELVASNWRLVVSVARKFMNSNLSLDLLDLVQEGNFGLLIAVDRFEPERGYNFSTYATWWVRQAISRAIANQDRPIRLPAYLLDRLYNYKREATRLTQALGREPFYADFRQADIGLTEPQLKNIAWAASCQTVSLDQLVDEEDGDGPTLLDRLPDVAADDPAVEAFSHLQHDTLQAILKSHLTERELAVMNLRFGLGNGRAVTLEKVGEKIGVTRERVRQIEQAAIQRLRHPSVLRQLQDLRYP